MNVGPHPHNRITFGGHCITFLGVPRTFWRKQNKQLDGLIGPEEMAVGFLIPAGR